MQEQPERKLRRLLGVRAVEAATGLKRTALDEAIKNGDVPKPVKPTNSKTRRWFEDEIIAYQEARAATRDNPKPKKKGK